MTDRDYQLRLEAGLTEAINDASTLRTELEQARAEVAQERESVRHQFRMLEELRAEFRRVKAEAERYRAALVKIDDDCGACEIVLPGSPDPCPAEYPGDQDMWCTGCLARTALSKEEP